MGTKTVDEAGTTEATEVKPEDEAAAAAEAEAAEETEEATAEADLVEDGSESGQEGPSGVGQGAGAVVAAALGVVSLTGSWVGTVAAARQTLVGQLQTSSSASVAKQIKAVYGDAWQASALWGGVFALLALIVGVVVLVRPAFGAPGRPQAAWIKSVAWGGVALGVIGLLLAVLKYTDVLLGLPSAG
ncbi:MULTISPECIES: hypothetical protein [Streptomyces]|uniref:Integral membrane protein n=1 Tax=Streptomyces gilvifuscus TaxID=1550617 RepID=A0ABT5G1F6_9ACTN|nr:MULTISPECIES: hypothetical protein [Streptomyces]MBK3641701.1 hypothetical protein [Streptomyces sp. MBT33]MDC2958555.1 hypothetical protein [Streptomyces gilvifuscus]